MPVSSPRPFAAQHPASCLQPSFRESENQVNCSFGRQEGKTPSLAVAVLMGGRMAAEKVTLSPAVILIGQAESPLEGLASMHPSGSQVTTVAMLGRIHTMINAC